MVSLFVKNVSNLHYMYIHACTCKLHYIYNVYEFPRYVYKFCEIQPRKGTSVKLYFFNIVTVPLINEDLTKYSDLEKVKTGICKFAIDSYSCIS